MFRQVRLSPLRMITALVCSWSLLVCLTSPAWTLAPSPNEADDQLVSTVDLLHVNYSDTSDANSLSRFIQFRGKSEYPARTLLSSVAEQRLELITHPLANFQRDLLQPSLLALGVAWRL